MSSPPRPDELALLATSITDAVLLPREGPAVLTAWFKQRNQLSRLRTGYAEAIANAANDAAAKLLYRQWLEAERVIAFTVGERLDDQNRHLAAKELQDNQVLASAWQPYGDLPFGAATSLSTTTSQARQPRSRIPAPAAPAAGKQQSLPVLTGPTSTAPSSAAAAAAASGGAASSSSSSSSGTGVIQWAPGAPATGAGPAAGAPSFSTGGGAPPTEPPSAGAAKKGRPEPTSELPRRRVLDVSRPEAVGIRAADAVRDRTSRQFSVRFFPDFDAWLAYDDQTQRDVRQYLRDNPDIAENYKAAAQQAFLQEQAVVRPQWQRGEPTMQSDAELNTPYPVVVAGEFVFDDDNDASR